MRFKHKRIGEERIISRFLLLPKTINRETRWLERVEYAQIYKKDNGAIFDVYYWVDCRWVDGIDDLFGWDDSAKDQYNVIISKRK